MSNSFRFEFGGLPSGALVFDLARHDGEWWCGVFAPTKGTSQDEQYVQNVLVGEQVAPEGLEVLHRGLAVDR